MYRRIKLFSIYFCGRSSCTEIKMPLEFDYVFLVTLELLHWILHVIAYPQHNILLLLTEMCFHNPWDKEVPIIYCNFLCSFQSLYWLLHIGFFARKLVVSIGVEHTEFAAVVYVEISLILYWCTLPYLHLRNPPYNVTQMIIHNNFFRFYQLKYHDFFSHFFKML